VNNANVGAKKEPGSVELRAVKVLMLTSSAQEYLQTCCRIARREGGNGAVRDAALLKGLTTAKSHVRENKVDIGLFHIVNEDKTATLGVTCISSASDQLLTTNSRLCKSMQVPPSPRRSLEVS
jgi:hypothetical protein